ncbi:unnamed protein product [Malus baccata var. baccata]
MDAISDKFKKLKSFHTLPHVMSCKGYGRLGDELRNKGTPEEDLNRVNLWIAARTRKNALGPEHRGRLRGGGYGVTPSRYDAQTIKLNMVNTNIKLNMGNGKETNTNDAIQVSTDGPQVKMCSQFQLPGFQIISPTLFASILLSVVSFDFDYFAPEGNYGSRHSSKASSHIQCDRRSAREADDASRQASKRSSPNIKRDSVKRKEGSKATFQGLHALLNWLENGKVVATGEIESTNPEVKVHHMVLGPDCWKVWVTVVRVENMSLYRPTMNFVVKLDPNTSTIAWPSKYIQVGE